MIYSKIELSKTNHQIPLLNNGKYLHSKYNPLNESESFFSTINNFSNGNFIICFGIGGGYHLNKLIQENPQGYILAVEYDSASLDFISSIENIKNLKLYKNIEFTTLENFSEKLLNLYSPLFFSDIKILFHRVWYEENKTSLCNLEENINSILKSISQDFSTQGYFSKLWTKNIILNYKEFENSPLSYSSELNKTAAIIAAGPTLDTSLKSINQATHYIISTDTALGALLQNNIIPDLVVNIDCQNISHTHYNILNTLPHETKKLLLDKTTFIFDISSDHSTVKSLKSQNYKIHFIKNNNPLTNYLDSENEFLNITSGSGTVTIACTHLASTLGFKKIEFFGADFGYTQKPYAKGTYLDTNFLILSSKINSQEEQFSALQFRTPLYQNNNVNTNALLESYKISLQNFLKSINYKKDNKLYINNLAKPVSVNKKVSIENHIKNIELWYKSIHHIINQPEIITKIQSKKDLLSYPELITLLPLCAKFKKEKPELSVNETIKLAYSLAKRYN